MNYFKKFWPYLVALTVFVVVACVYMSPVLDGKEIATTDGIQAIAAQHEGMDYHDKTGERSWWTGSMFCGMPNYQIGGGRYEADNWILPLKRLLLWGHRNVIAIVIIYCIGFFCLLRSMKISEWLSIVGALAIAFSSYFFIIIGANHHGKTSTLALMSMVAAGLYLIFNGHRKIGVVMTMICSAVGFYPHPQMAYYICFIIGFFWIAELCKAVTSKQWLAFGLNTLIFGASFGIGIGTGTAATFANLEYAEETMRGGHSDLVKEKDGENKTKGLDLDYATAWSYGIDECWTFLVPNYMGGSSNYSLGTDSQLFESMVKKGVPRKSAEQFCQQVPTYWGDQPFTAGPVYMGAIICMLFVLGLIIVDGPYKWALLAVTILSVCLSWGNHWMDLTRFFFENVPMYNKFRAVSSILVIAEITMPVLGFLALKRLTEGAIEQQKAFRAVCISGGVTGGLCVLLAVFGSEICTFTSPNDAAMFSQLPDWLTEMILAQRHSMMVSDSWRSLLFIALATALLLAYLKMPKMKIATLSILLGVLVLADMWPVNQRFMNDDMFTKSGYEKAFRMTAYEKEILKDKDPHYRVFNLASNTFNDARTSYYLKSLGGYSAAKLRRYQDIIDQHLSKMHWSVINMLNAKYVIFNDPNGGGTQFQLNPSAMGNAWFVGELKVVNTPNEECDALDKIDLHTVAVLDKDFSSYVKNAHPGIDSTAVVRLTKYTPEYIEYESSSSKEGTIVFSEIYYPHGWKALVDGQEVDHYRVNYLLRALNVSAGNHKIRFEFRPESVAKGNVLSMTFVVLMMLIIVGLIASNFIPSLGGGKKEA